MEYFRENFGVSKKFLEHEPFLKFFQKLKISLSNFVVEDVTRSGCRKMNRAISSYSDTSSIDDETLPKRLVPENERIHIFLQRSESD